MNSLLYPAPKTSYNKETLYGELIYIPRLFHRGEIRY